MPIVKKKEFERRLQSVESLIGELDTLEDAAARGTAAAAVQALLELHGDALNRLLEVVAEKGPPGEMIIGELAADEMVGGLLILHGLHPVTLEDRIRGALTRVRPYLGSHGGNVELLGVTDGVARLRLEGSCHGCASSTLTLKYAIEREIAQAAPDLIDLVVDGVTPPPSQGFIPLTQIKPMNSASTAGTDVWKTVTGLDSVVGDRVTMHSVGDARVLFCRVGSATYAYREGCPECGVSLQDGTLKGEVLTCSACGQSYDVKHAGRRLEGAGAGMTPIPLLEEAGHLKLAAAAVAG